jgi:hypothetical protein
MREVIPKGQPSLAGNASHLRGTPHNAGGMSLLGSLFAGQRSLWRLNMGSLVVLQEVVRGSG